MFAKKFVPLYLEEIKFAVLRCGWKVTKLYKHYYFDQERCKPNFILMNQKARQEAPDKVESDFCKLLNNSNFGCDCRNNLDNCIFQPINDKINELRFIKRYHSNLYDKDLRPFITSRVLQEDIDKRYNNERQKIKETDILPLKLEVQKIVGMLKTKLLKVLRKVRKKPTEEAILMTS